MKKLEVMAIAAALLLSGCGASGSNTANASAPGGGSGASSAAESVPEEIPGLLQVTTAEAAKMLEEETGYLLVDARPAEDFRKSHIPGSINVPNESVGEEPPAELPDKNQRIFLYCGGGGLSYYLALKLHDMGYTDLVKFAGMKEWTGPVEGEEVQDSSQGSRADSESSGTSSDGPAISSQSSGASDDSFEEAIRPILMLDGSSAGDKDGVSMKVTGFIPGESLRAVVVNNSKETFYLSPAFLLERREGDAWVSVPGMDELSFIDIAEELPSKTSREVICDISALGIDSGEYRLTKSGLASEFSLVYSE